MQYDTYIRIVQAVPFAYSTIPPVHRRRHATRSTFCPVLTYLRGRGKQAVHFSCFQVNS